MGKGSAAAEPDVLDRQQKFPGREDFRIFAPRWEEKVNRENNQISRQNAQGAPGEESPELDVSAARERSQKVAADQVTAQNEEEIDADPAEAIDAAGRFESKKRGVIDRDDDDGDRTKKIETRLALTIRETRIDGYFGSRLVNGGMEK